MKILVTGSKGMIGTALINNLRTIKDGINKTRPNIHIDEIFEYDIGDKAKLDEYCKKADFIFNFAGVNRPKDSNDFHRGNYDFSSLLLKTLKKYNNKAPVMLSSSIQATLIGRYNNDYGRSKKETEELFLNTEKIIILKFLSIVFLISWVIHVLIIIVQYQHFVGPLLMINHILLIINQPNLNFYT